MVNIAFSALHQNTAQCMRIGEELIALNHNVVYISDDAFTSDELPHDKALILKSKIKTFNAHEILPDDFLSKIFMRDRFVKRHISYEDFKILANQWANEITAFFNSNEVEVFVFEGTPAYELIAEFIAKQLNVMTICPAQFNYGGKSHGVLYTNSIWQNAYLLSLTKIPKLTGVSDSNQVVTYHNKDHPLVKRIISFFDRRSLNAPTRTDQVYNFIIKLLNFIINSHSSVKRSHSPISNDITFFMHMDPEKSVDNSGADIWPQIEMIKDLRHRLPSDMNLLVRDHPHLGLYRSPKEIKKIQAIAPNIHYVNGKTSKKEIFLTSKGICTISGTVAIEAAQMGLPVLCYGKPIYIKHTNVFHIDDFDQYLYSIVDDKRECSTKIYNDLFEEFIAKRLGSFVFGDVNLLDGASSQDNNRNLANAIIKAVEYKRW